MSSILAGLAGGARGFADNFERRLQEQVQNKRLAQKHKDDLDFLQQRMALEGTLRKDLAGQRDEAASQRQQEAIRRSLQEQVFALAGELAPKANIPSEQILEAPVEQLLRMVSDLRGLQNSLAQPGLEEAAGLKREKDEAAIEGSRARAERDRAAAALAAARTGTLGKEGPPKKDLPRQSQFRSEVSRIESRLLEMAEGDVFAGQLSPSKRQNLRETAVRTVITQMFGEEIANQVDYDQGETEVWNQATALTLQHSQRQLSIDDEIDAFSGLRE